MAAGNIDHTQWYTTTCGPHRYTLPIRYQESSSIGVGAFGAVM